MWLAKVRYYGEFVVLAILIVALAVFGLRRASPEQGAVWLAALILGAAIWTLVEYGLHRVVLHHVPYVRKMHEAHHDDQTALIVIPIWVSLGLFAGLAFLPMCLLTGRGVATGITGGLLLGYLWFDAVHHAIHQEIVMLASWTDAHLPADLNQRSIRRWARYCGGEAEGRSLWSSAN